MIRVLIADDHPIVREGLRRQPAEQVDLGILPDDLCVWIGVEC